MDRSILRRNGALRVLNFRILIFVLFLLAGMALVAVAALLAGIAGTVDIAGALFMLQGPERVLALLGMGLAAATLPRGGRIATLVAFLAGSALGLLARSTPAWPILTGEAVYHRLHLLGPAASILSGLTLMLPDRLRRVASPLAAFAIAAALVLTAEFNDPDPAAMVFSLTAALAALWVFLSVAGVASMVRRPWFRIAGRIVASWLLAIGLLLAGAQLAPHNPVTVPVVIDPGAGRTFVPGLGPVPTRTGRPGDFQSPPGLGRPREY